MSEEIRRAVLDGGDAGAIGRAARESGMVSMRDDGLLKVLRGRTTLEEVERVTADA